MSYKLPMSISTEQDLNAFENYLLNDIKQFSKTESENTLKSLLQKNINKYITLETTFGFRKGKLLAVGMDFVCLGCKNSQNQLLINFSKINSFILPQGN